MHVNSCFPSSEAMGLNKKIICSGYHASLVVSGGGIGLLHSLLSCPGASRFVLESQVPYSPAAMHAFLGQTPEQFCSKETALALAARAYERAAFFGINPLGVACTAALQSDRPRRGQDRAYAALMTAAFTKCYRLSFFVRERRLQEEALSHALLEILAECLIEGYQAKLNEDVECRRLSTSS